MMEKDLQELSVEDVRRYFDGWHLDIEADEAVRENTASSISKVYQFLGYLPSQSGRILQLGAEPYFLSSLLSRFGDFDLYLADYYHSSANESYTERSALISDSYSEDNMELPIRSFDFEGQRYPYPSQYFDGVILNDVLQKLVRDPVKVFTEVHRVLKQDGWLLFDTLNAAYYGNLVKIWLGQNVYAPYSTQEPYDRANRPYTIPEIIDLFQDLRGFEITMIEGHDLSEDKPSDLRMRIAKLMIRLVKRADLNSEHIFCLVKKKQALTPLWPSYLYKTYQSNRPQGLKPLDRSELELPEVTPGSSCFSRRICKLCDLEDWYGDEWLGYLDAMGEGSYRVGNRQRKAWEWAQGLYALERMGLLREDATALGVGAGTEQILFYLANRIGMVTATDIYGHGDFVGLTAYQDMLTEPEKYSQIDYRRDHLSVEHMDGTALEYPDDHFDFAFSFSSIEHFGGHDAAAKAVREMGRVIRPGGLVIITTEIILNGFSHRELFLPEEINSCLIESSNLVLLEDIDFRISDETLKQTVDFSHPGLRMVNPQVICKLGGIYWTSICLALVKEA